MSEQLDAEASRDLGVDAALSLILSPLTAFACETVGAMGMGFRRFVLASLLGRIVLGLLLAYLGSGLERWLDLHLR